MPEYVSPFSSGGGSGGGGGSPRNPSAGYTSSRMKGYVSPFSKADYRIPEPPDPMKSGFSVGNQKYNNIDHYVANFDKLSKDDRKKQYEAFQHQATSDPLAQGIVGNLDQKGRSQKTTTREHLGNAVRDVNHAQAAVGRFLIGGTAKLANQAYQEGKQIVNTGTTAWETHNAGQKSKDTIAAKKTGDPIRINAANSQEDRALLALKRGQDQTKKDYEGFQKGKGGILSVGTLTSADEAKKGEAKTGVKRIGGGTLMAAGEILPFAKGAGIGIKGVEGGAQFLSAGRKAELAARAAEEASKLSKGEKAAKAAIAGTKRLITNAAYGTAGSVGGQLVNEGKVNPVQVAKDAAAAAATGEVIHQGGQLLSKVFQRGSKAALKDALAAKAANPTADVSLAVDKVDGALAAAKAGDQKLLPQGNIRNESTSIVKGKPAIPGDAGTPTKVPVSDAEYQKRFDDLGKSYEKGMKDAQAQKGSLAQSIAADQVHESHLNALNQLDHEHQHGKANPDFKPAVSGTAATPDTTVQSGFQIIPKDSTVDHHAPIVANDQRAQIHQRIGQIDTIVKNAQNNGTTRTAQEMRGLMRERADAQHVLDGNKSYEDVYGSKKTTTKPLPFGDKAPAEGQAAMPHPDTPVDKGGSMFTSLPKVAEGDTAAPILHHKYIQGQYDTLNKKIQEAGSKLDAHDTKLIESIESSTPQTAEQAAQRVKEIAAGAHKPKEFTAAVQALKDFSEARLNNDTALGRDVSKRENYLSRFYKRGDSKQSGALDRLNLTGDSLPGYTKERSIATQAEADALAAMKNADGTPKYPNLERANANVFEDARQAADMAKADHGKQAMKLAMEQAHPGVKVGVNKIGFDPESGLSYKGLDITGGSGLSMPKTIADHYNGRASSVPKDVFGIKLPDGTIKPVKDNEIVQRLKETGGKLVDPVTGKSLHNWKINRIVRQAYKDPVGAYDKFNANLKYSILGGGTFHAVTTGGTVAGQQSMRALAHPLQIPSMIKDNLSLVRGTISKGSHDAVMAAHEADGSLGFAHLTGVTLGSKEILGDANSGIVDKMKDTKWNPIKQVHDAVFQRQIPEAKMMIVKQSMQTKFKGMDFKAPTAEQVAFGRKVASAVNNIGGINRAVEGLSPGTAKKLSRVLLATDFTEGKFRIIGNALNPTKIKTPEAVIARQMIIGKSVLFALPGLAALTASGQLDWSKPQDVRKAVTDQLLDPNVPLNSKGAPTKSNPEGASQAAHLPGTFISEFGKILKPALDPLQPDKMKGVKDYVTNRAAAAPAIASRVKQNKDFHGDPIYGQDKDGNSISPFKTALNVGNQVAPIPIVQGSKRVSHQQNTRDTLLNVAGFKVSSDPNAATGKHAQSIQDFYTTLNQSSNERGKVSKQIDKLITDNNPSQAYRVAQTYNEALPQRLQTFRQKYNDHYNPAWDQEFKKLEIPLTAKSFKSRQKSNNLKSAVLSNAY